MQRIKRMLLFFAIHPFISFGQDIRGGEINYTYISNLTYKYDIYLYTRTSMGINHSSISFHLGDGSLTTLTGSSNNLPNDITEWHYAETHIFPGGGSYTSYAQDSFRIASIQNIINSDSTTIVPSATMRISGNILSNSSPIFLNKQTDLYKNGNYFVHNPGAYDPDGDSLVFSLSPCSVLNYSFPPGASIDPTTGIFQMPITSGIYAINIKVEEWRGGSNIGITYREMLIDSSIISGIIPQSSDEVDLKIFPNPATNQLTITTNTNTYSEIILYDIASRKLMEEKFNGSVSLNIGHLAKGIYLYQLTDEKGLISRGKVVKE